MRRGRIASLVFGLTVASSSIPAQPNEYRAEARGEHVTLAAFVAPYLGSGSTTQVLVGIEVTGDGSSGPDVGAAAILPLTIAVTPEATSPTSPSVPAPLALDRTSAVPFLTEFALPPGRYELHLAEPSESTSQTSSRLSLVLPFEVPTAARPPSGSFLMSPITLSSTTVGTPAAGDASERRQLFSLLLRPPTPRRRFGRDEQLETFVEIYDWDSEPGFEQQFTVRTSVRRDEGATVVHTHEETGISELLDSGLFGYAHSALIPLDGLSSGRYVVDITVDSLSSASRVQRSVAFTVE